MARGQAIVCYEVLQRYASAKSIIALKRGVDCRCGLEREAEVNLYGSTANRP